MENMFDEFLMLLKENDWNEKTYDFMKDDYFNRIKKQYKKGNYEISDELINQMTYVYDTKLKFTSKQGSNDEFIFNSKGAHKYSVGFRQRLAEKLGCQSVTYIGFLEQGPLTIWIDDNMQVWGLYDYLKVYYGKGFYNGIINICSDNGDCVRTEER